MELIIAATIAGIVFGIFVLWIIWRAVGNAMDWLIETFGNEEAAKHVRERRSNKG
jgi:hypothetical protein